MTTAGPTFTLKDISAAPNLPRLEWTERVLHHVAQAGVQVPFPLRTRSAAAALPFQGRFYTLTTWIEAGAYPHEPEVQAQLFLHTGQAIARLVEALGSYLETDLHHQTWREDFFR